MNAPGPAPHRDPPNRQSAEGIAARQRRQRPLREASLVLRRIDPWVVLKISLIVSIVMFFVWVLAAAVLYLSLGSLDVWTQLNQTYKTLANASHSTLITTKGFFVVASAIGIINIVLFTTLSTIASFLYNAAAGMSGGVEITLSERA
ncbi:MAG: DUF3566 domain-containing protein [Nakamurella sp.]